MKSLISLILVAFALFTISCNNECQSLLDRVSEARVAYENNPSQTNCLNFEKAMNSYLASSCEDPYGIVYEDVFGSYLESLNCTSAAAPTCTDGVMNGNETGVDCGGDCPPC